MRLRIALIAFAALATFPAAAAAKTEVAALGTVTAELTYEERASGFPEFFNLQERILRGGVVAFSAPSPPSSSCPDGCPALPAFAGRANAVKVVQLDATPEPEVIYDYFTGGAHCCFYSHILRYQAGAYTGMLHDWLDPGYTLQELNGDTIPEFVSADGRFGYVFGSFAGSRFPPQIWRYENGLLADVTRQFPDRIKAAARKLRRTYKRNPDRLGVEQVLLGYTADECLLGSCGPGFKLIKQAAKGDFVKARFLSQVKRFLGKVGYL